MLKLLIQRPIGILITLVAMIALGLIAYFTIPLQLLPSGFNTPFIWVSIPTLTSAPEENELTIAQPMEDALSTLPDLKELESYIRSDNVNFHVNLYPESDVDLAYQRLRARLKKEIPKLPDGAQFAYLWRHDPNDDPVLVLGLSYPDHINDPSILIQEKLVKAIERIPGVSNVELAGIKSEQVRILVKQELLSKYGLGFEHVAELLQKNQLIMSAGKLKDINHELMVRMIAQADTVEQLKDLQISENLKLKDIAQIIIAPDDAPLIHRVNGKNAISIVIYKASTANTIAVSSQAWQTVEQMIQVEPKFQDFELMRFFDQGLLIKNSLNQLNQSALIGGLIAMICLYFFLRSIKLTVLITLAIPLCLLLSIGMLYLQGESLNLLSMMGLVISVGMVIDNAIVVLENIEQRRKNGESAIQSAILAVKEVGLAISLATLTTIIVFLPLAVLSKGANLSFFLGKLGTTVTYALLISLVIALLHVPVATVWISMIRKELGALSKNEALKTLPYPKYAKIIAWTLDQRLLCTVLVFLFMISIAYPLNNLKRINQQGGDSFGAIRVNIMGPANGPHEKLDRIAKEVENKLWGMKNELGLSAVVAQRGFSAEHVRVVCYLEANPKNSMSQRERTQKIKENLPVRPGYRIQIGRPGQGQGGGDGVNISVYGPNLATTVIEAQGVIDQLKKIKSIEDIEEDIPEGGMELKVLFDGSASYLYGSSPIQGALALNQQLQKRKIGEMIINDQPINVMLESFEARQNSLSADQSIEEQIKQLPMVFSSQQQKANNEILFDQAAQLKLEVGPGKILRKNRRVHINLVLAGDEVKIMADLKQALPHIKLPIGYGINKGNRFEEQEQNESSGLLASLVGMALVFCIMGLLFESFLLPISILITIPLAFVGTIWTLWLTNTPFEVMAMIGCVILIGVVVNHGIVLIDQVQQKKDLYGSRKELLIAVTQERIRPILMTTLTTICGLIPMALSKSDGMGIDYSPLGKVVLGGMLTSALLTLLVLPLFYSVLDDLSRLPTRIKNITSKINIFF